MNKLTTSCLLVISLMTCSPNRETARRKVETSLQVAKITKDVTSGPMTVVIEYRPENMATWAVPGKSVYSPFTEHQLVDITGLKPGERIKCPYSGKDIIIPELQNEGGEGKEQKSQIPTARWVIGSEGHIVFSPFSNSGLVSVEGIESGTKVKCPMTGKIFIVPQK